MNDGAAKAVGELYMDPKSVEGSLACSISLGLGLGDGAIEMDWWEDGEREWLRHMERQSEDKGTQSSWVSVWCAGESAERGDPEGHGEVELLHAISSCLQTGDGDLLTLLLRCAVRPAESISIKLDILSLSLSLIFFTSTSQNGIAMSGAIVSNEITIRR